MRFIIYLFSIASIYYFAEGELLKAIYWILFSQFCFVNFIYNKKQDENSQNLK